jgi:BirA family biotin operon repressor/biotin-[acetyl-CoA-carboxylase] ligase
MPENFYAPLGTVDAVAAELPPRLPGFGEVSWLESTGSTNAELLARVRAGGGAPMPWLLGTHEQTSGRGRAGRSFQSGVGSTLTFSCAFEVFAPAAQLPSLSPLCGLAVCEALRSLVGPVVAPGLGMKWPNDIQWGDAKLAGILVESVRCPGPGPQRYGVVIGMGVNLHGADALSKRLGRSIADWQYVVGAFASDGASGEQAAAVSAADIVAACALAWRDALAQFEREGFGSFLPRFKRVDVLGGRVVDVLELGVVLASGQASGCDGTGRLLLEQADGQVIPISVGDISIRPQAGTPHAATRQPAP